MIAGAFYEPTALNIVLELGITDLIGKERVPVSQLVRKVNVDKSQLREFAIFYREIFKVYIFVCVSRTCHEDACEQTGFP